MHTTNAVGEIIGEVICGQHAKVQLRLRKVGSSWRMEIAETGDRALPHETVVSIPAEQIPKFTEAVLRAKDRCVKGGLAWDGNEMVTMIQGDRVHLPATSRGPQQPQRKSPRVPARYPVECRVVSAGIESPLRLSGELRDVGAGGAQVCLRTRLDLLQPVELLAVIGGQEFRASAEVVSVGLRTQREPGTGYIRHGLRWRQMGPASRQILATLLDR